MNSKKDLIIIGGGPSGLMSALTASKIGLSAVLIEKKHDIGTYKRSCCSMLLTEPGMHGDYLAFRDNTICFLKNDFSVRYTGRYADLWQSIRISPSGNTLKLGKRAYPIAKVIDKAQLQRDLLNDIDTSKVDILTGTVASNLEQGDKGVKVKITNNGKQSWIEGKIALVCDGVNSPIVNNLGLNKERKHFFTSKVVSYVLANTHIPYPNSWITFMGKSASPTGAIYMLPKPIGNGESDVYEISQGLPLLGKLDYSAKWLLDNFLKNSSFKEWFADAKIIDVHGTTHIMRSPLSDPRYGKALFVGDSASFMEVDNQGALMCGYRAAHSALSEIEGGNGFEQYKKFWESSFEFNNEALLSPIIKGFGLSAFSDEEINYLFSLTEGERYDGYVNHFTIGKLILGIFVGKMNKIKAERPDIAEKFSKFLKQINE